MDRMLDYLNNAARELEDILTIRATPEMAEMGKILSRSERHPRFWTPSRSAPEGAEAGGPLSALEPRSTQNTAWRRSIAGRIAVLVRQNPICPGRSNGVRSTAT